MCISVKYSALSELFCHALYDNDDWEVDFGTTQKLFKAYLLDPENNYGEWVLEALVEETEDYLSTNPSEAQVYEDIIRLCNRWFYPDEGKAREWFLEIQQIFKELLAQFQKEKRY